MHAKSMSFLLLEKDTPTLKDGTLALTILCVIGVFLFDHDHDLPSTYTSSSMGILLENLRGPNIYSNFPS